MSDRSELPFALVVIGTVGLIIIVGAMIGSKFATDMHRKEAVERGYAEWSVDASGNTSWHWKEAAEEESNE